MAKKLWQTPWMRVFSFVCALVVALGCVGAGSQVALAEVYHKDVEFSKLKKDDVLTDGASITKMDSKAQVTFAGKCYKVKGKLQQEDTTVNKKKELKVGAKGEVKLSKSLKLTPVVKDDKEDKDKTDGNAWRVSANIADGVLTLEGVKLPTVTVAANPADAGKAAVEAGSAAYKKGESVTLTATPQDGYTFVSWTSDQVAAESGSFVMPEGDVTVTANFEPVAVPEPEEDQAEAPEVEEPTGDAAEPANQGDDQAVAQDENPEPAQDDTLSLMGDDGGDQGTATEPSVTVGTNSIVVYVGAEGENVNASASPEEATLSYSSDDEAVVSVDGEGNLTFGTAGTAMVTVTATLEGEEGEEPKTDTATISVTVNKKEQTIEASDLEGRIGESGKIVPSSDADGATFSFEVVSGGEYVTVHEETGDVTYNAAGTAEVKITASETETYAAAEKTVTVTVNKKKQTIEASGLEGKVGQTGKITPSSDADGGTFSFKVVSGGAYVTVNEKTGEVTYNAAGTAEVQITASETDTYAAADKTIDVIVNKGVQTITAAKTQTITVGKSGTIKHSSNAADAGDDVRWSFEVPSGDNHIELLDSASGKIKAVNKGEVKVTIHASDTDNYEAAEKTITVKVVKGEQAIQASNLKGKVGQSGTITATSNAEDATLTYKVVSGKDFVAVNKETGKITLKAVGTAKVKIAASATDNYEAAEKTITVTVSKGIQKITQSNLKGTVGQTGTINPTSNAEGATFTFEVVPVENIVAVDNSEAVSAEDIVTVDKKTGKITLKAAGIAEVKITASETDQYEAAEKTITVTVNDASATTYTLHFDANGGTGAMADQVFTSGEAQAISKNAFTRPGYTFLGWNTQADGSAEITVKKPDGTTTTIKYIADGTKLTLKKDTTLYAQWQKNDIQQGKLTTKVVVSNGAPKVESTNLDDVAKSVLTQEEKTAVNNGANASVNLYATGLDETAVAEDVKNALLAGAKTKGATAGAWFDLSLKKKVGDNAEVNITELDAETPLMYLVKIPDSLKNTDEDKIRTFYLIRYHNGKVYLSAQSTSTTLSGRTSEFSTYLIAYKDTAKVSTKPNSRSGSNGNGKLSKTGDSSLAGSIPLVIAVAGAAVVAVGIVRRKRS